MIPAIKENPFSHRAIWLYAVAFVFYATNHMLIIALPFLSQKLGAARMEIGIIMGSYMFVSMFLRPVAGKVVDRFGSRNIFMIALVLNAIVLISYTVGNLWAFAVMRALQGAILAFFSMTVHLLIMDLLTDKVRGQGLSLLSLASMLPYTFVPALVLFMKDQVTITGMLLLFAVLGFCNIFLGVRLYTLLGQGSLKQNKQEMEPVTTEGKRKAGKAIVFPALVMLLASIVFCIAPTYMPLYLESRGLDTAPLYFLVETGVLILIRFFGRKYIPSSDSFPKGLLILLVICFTLSPALLALTLSTPVLLAAAICNGLALSLLYPTLMTYISFVVPEKVRGYSIGWFIAAADFGTSSGAFLMGLVADAFTYRGMLVAAVCIGVLTLLLTLCHRGQKAVAP
ncbi:staphylopine family metallophore export MFS transporter CntE [Paenibacillus nasutitermitis]|uniref:MFS transporter n=1 Tax=Paenibacillus nasutitermitis TaxID=1652958 RepID=A0A916YI88_9BACL|nr:MFS transporter [Paenibacillus nasutitermitis]GGD46821.1 MFS transporter [Paenibacillus nasutitermitis]